MSIAQYLTKFALGVTPEGLLSPEKGGTGSTTGAGNTPTITAIAYTGNDTATNTAGGDTVTINGTNFNVGITVLVGNTQVSQVTRVSATQITFPAPANAAGSYILYVVNTDGSTALAVPGLQYSGIPAWTTASGSLGSPNKLSSFTATLAATGDAPITYSVIGTLPTGITLNSSTGVLSGTTPDESVTTTYNFTIRASDAQNQDTDRPFSLTVIALTVPGAPTIGNATATSWNTATVAFTAPANNGNTTITSYTATSNPGGLTGTVTQAGSGTITVSGLSGSTSYTFTVTATNSVGTGSASAASTSINTPAPAPSVIGEAWGGGYYAGKISTSNNGVATHYLIVAPKSTEVFGKTFINGTNNNAASEIDGPTNTANIDNATGSDPARYCQNLVTGGYSDWYLPAKNELETIYFFLKPTEGNGTGYQAGATHTNAVAPEPIGTAYTSTVPGQTTALAFRQGGGQHFEPSQGTANYPYWCSTEHWSTDQWRAQRFDAGHQEVIPRSYGAWTRAVRRIPV
jgi:hypothetical protein